MLKRNVELIAIALILGAALPLTAHARACELPHEQLQLRCGGDAPNTYDPEALPSAQSASAVQKARPAADILKEYREKAGAFAELVRKADEDYRLFISQK